MPSSTPAVWASAGRVDKGPPRHQDTQLKPSCLGVLVAKKGLLIGTTFQLYEEDWIMKKLVVVTLLVLSMGSFIALGSTGSPFGPGDFTAAYKFQLTLAAGDTAAIDLQLGRFQ